MTSIPAGRSVVAPGVGSAPARVTVAVCCLIALFLGACSAVERNARSMEQAGKLDQAARQYEVAAKSSSGGKASRLWYRAAKLWVDPANPRRSYARALACFRRVQVDDVGGEVAHETKLWRSVLANLVSAQDAAREAESIISAFEDVSRGAPASR